MKRVDLWRNKFYRLQKGSHTHEWKIEEIGFKEWVYIICSLCGEVRKCKAIIVEAKDK